MCAWKMGDVQAEIPQIQWGNENRWFENQNSARLTIGLLELVKHGRMNRADFLSWQGG